MMVQEMKQILYIIHQKPLKKSVLGYFGVLVASRCYMSFKSSRASQEQHLEAANASRCSSQLAREDLKDIKHLEANSAPKYRLIFLIHLLFLNLLNSSISYILRFIISYFLSRFTFLPTNSIVLVLVLVLVLVRRPLERVGVFQSYRDLYSLKFFLRDHVRAYETT